MNDYDIMTSLCQTNLLRNRLCTKASTAVLMADLVNELDEILNILQLEPSQDKVFAYSSLLKFQEFSVNESTKVEALISQNSRILSIVITDLSVENEEILAGALKCLGFIVYHPSLVADIPDNDAALIIDSLVKLLMTAKSQAVCNLCVWSIAIQQFKSSILNMHFGSLLTAVIHALDNPSGWLSTAYEAMQALIKLGDQLNKNMRSQSHVWVPTLCRRLLSADKREREMSERCLLKMKSCIFPPLLDLSKAILDAIRLEFLLRMKEMMDDCQMLLHVVKAWGWYIHLLGQLSLTHKNLLNEMLKIPERTFPSRDTRVQIASLVAWEALIDSLIQHQVSYFKVHINGAQSAQLESSTEVKILLKGVKLIMKPLVEIISWCKNEFSVHSACLNTWRYLLFRLDLLVNFDPFVGAVLEPVLELIFRTRLTSGNDWMWSSCMSLLKGFILSKAGKADGETAEFGILAVDAWRSYPIKWLPWNFRRLPFFLKMMHINISCLLATSPAGSLKVACDATSMVFRYILQGVRVDLVSPSVPFDEVIIYIRTILKFFKELCEDQASRFTTDCSRRELMFLSLFFDILLEVFGPSVLESPLYQMPLDLQCIKDLKSDQFVQLSGMLGMETLSEDVSPMIYVAMLYFSVMVQFVLRYKCTVEMRKCLKCISLSVDPVGVLRIFLYILYMHVTMHKNQGLSFLRMWELLATFVIDLVDVSRKGDVLRIEFDESYCQFVCWLLCYPLLVCSLWQEILSEETENTCSHWQEIPSEESGRTSETCLMLHEGFDFVSVIGTWKDLFNSASNTALHSNNSSIFAECLADKLLLVFGTDSGPSAHCGRLFCFAVVSEVLLHIIENMKLLNAHQLQFNSMRNSLRLVAWLLKMSFYVIQSNWQHHTSVVARIFATLTCFIDHLCFKKDVILFVEEMSDALIYWLSSCTMMLEEEHLQNVLGQFTLFWIMVLDLIMRSQPSAVFDSVALDSHASLLLAALDHPHARISDATVAFWNASYGMQQKLRYPQSLLAVLDKLSREDKINVPGVNLAASEKTEALNGHDHILRKRRFSSLVEMIKTVGHNVGEIGHLKNLYGMEDTVFPADGKFSHQYMICQNREEEIRVPACRN